MIECDSDDEARLIEIDENLVRADLSPAERAAHIGERKKVYERIHPEVAAGTNQHKKGAVAKLATAPDRFTKDTAAKTGKSERAIQRDATRAKAIPRIADVAGTSLDKGAELDALAKLPTAKQAALIDRAKAGEKVSAQKAAPAGGQGTPDRRTDRLLSKPN